MSRMQQIAHAGAPFPDIDRAIAAGHEHARRVNGSIQGIVAEPQPGGYFARLVYSVPIGRGGRAGRKLRQTHTVEIGKIDGPAFHPINSTDLSGKPYFCQCGQLQTQDCQRFDCRWEDDRVAQDRLIAAHARAFPIAAHLAKYVEYIDNTGQRPLACSAFDEDWEPIGPGVRRQLVEAGLIEEYDGFLMLLVERSNA